MLNIFACPAMNTNPTNPQVKQAIYVPTSGIGSGINKTGFEINKIGFVNYLSHSTINAAHNYGAPKKLLLTNTQ